MKQQRIQNTNGHVCGLSETGAPSEVDRCLGFLFLLTTDIDTELAY